MSHYSCLKIISTKAKKMARASSVLTHSQALEIIAKQSSFSNYHELTRVAKYAPLEPRLLMAAFGDSDFADVIHNCNGSQLKSLRLAISASFGSH